MRISLPPFDTHKGLNGGHEPGGDVAFDAILAANVEPLILLADTAVLLSSSVKQSPSPHF
jgi:hypothetical protein